MEFKSTDELQKELVDQLNNQLKQDKVKTFDMDKFKQLITVNIDVTKYLAEMREVTPDEEEQIKNANTEMYNKFHGHGMFLIYKIVNKETNVAHIGTRLVPDEVDAGQ